MAGAATHTMGLYRASLGRQPCYLPARANLAALYWQQGDPSARRELRDTDRGCYHPLPRAESVENM
ncbi:MAG: hypothetical protein ACP5R2_09910 [Anaerolineae bacterium]